MNENLGPVLGRVPSGLSILTASDGRGATTGMLASWVQQASFDPPIITVAVNRKRYLNDWITETGMAAVSLIAESQKTLLGHFGKGFEPGEEAFSGLEIETTAAGLPVLPRSLGWLAGTVIGSLETGDHMIYALQISSSGKGTLFDDEQPWVHIRKNGLSY